MTSYPRRQKMQHSRAVNEETPYLSSFELLDDSMQKGYELSLDDRQKAFEEWERTWQLCKALAIKGEFTSVRELDDAFCGTQYVSNWIQDFPDLLTDKSDEEEVRQKKRIALLKDILSFPLELDELTGKNFTSDLGQELILNGDIEEGDRLFEDAVASDSSFAWNYIRWADVYGPIANDSSKNYEKALSILDKALQAEITEDKEYVYKRLEELLQISGLEFEYEVILPENQSNSSHRQRSSVDDTSGLFKNSAALHQDSHAVAKPSSAQKTGRNEICPCGSGLKYKKCCGRNHPTVRSSVVREGADEK